MTSSRLEIH